MINFEMTESGFFWWNCSVCAEKKNPESHLKALNSFKIHIESQNHLKSTARYRDNISIVSMTSARIRNPTLLTKILSTEPMGGKSESQSHPTPRASSLAGKASVPTRRNSVDGSTPSSPTSLSSNVVTLEGLGPHHVIPMTADQQGHGDIENKDVSALLPDLPEFDIEKSIDDSGISNLGENQK